MWICSADARSSQSYTRASKCARGDNVFDVNHEIWPIPVQYSSTIFPIKENSCSANAHTTTRCVIRCLQLFHKSEDNCQTSSSSSLLSSILCDAVKRCARLSTTCSPFYCNWIGRSFALIHYVSGGTQQTYYYFVRYRCCVRLCRVKRTEMR